MAQLLPRACLGVLDRGLDHLQVLAVERVLERVQVLPDHLAAGAQSPRREHGSSTGDLLKLSKSLLGLVREEVRSLILIRRS